MTQPQIMHVFGLPENSKYTLLRGPLKVWLQEQKIPAMHSARLRGWCVRSERVGDVIARAELAGMRVRMRGPVE